MDHPESLLTRYFGSHSLRLYGVDFFFVVMQDVFRQCRPINARFDLKVTPIFLCSASPSSRLFIASGGLGESS